MKKRVLSFLVALVILLAYAVPAFAATNIIGVDFTAEENQAIDNLSDVIKDTYGIEAYIAFDETVSGSEGTIALAKDTYSANASGENGICLAYSSDMYYVYTCGIATDMVPSSFEDDLWSYLSNYTDSYYNFSVAYYTYINSTLASSGDVEAIAEVGDGMPVDDYLMERQGHYVIDDAGLITVEQANALEEKLNEISTRQGFDVVVVTTNTLDGKTAEAYADDYYDYNGYGQGDSFDGCLLLVSMEDRDWHISTTGYGITALTDAGIDYISDHFVSYLSDGNYNLAFNTYADLVDEFVTHAKTSSPYDVGNLPKDAKKFEIKFLLYGLITGFIAALIIVSVLKAQLKSVSHKTEANEYLVEGSLCVTNQSDTFVTAHVSKTRREKSSGGGSSTHTGSSGTSHGGGGGKF